MNIINSVHLLSIMKQDFLEKNILITKLKLSTTDTNLIQNAVLTFCQGRKFYMPMAITPRDNYPEFP